MKRLFALLLRVVEWLLSREERRRRKELRDAKEKLRKAVESAADGDPAALDWINEQLRKARGL